MDGHCPGDGDAKYGHKYQGVMPRTSHAASFGEGRRVRTQEAPAPEWVPFYSLQRMANFNSSGQLIEKVTMNSERNGELRWTSGLQSEGLLPPSPGGQGAVWGVALVWGQGALKQGLGSPVAPTSNRREGEK